VRRGIFIRSTEHCFPGLKSALQVVEAIPMQTTNSHLLREMIRTALKQRAGSSSGANAISEATATTWRLVEAQLKPVIGARGLDVLFRRALQQSTTAFPWLAASVDRGGSADPLPSLTACLAAQQTAAAAEAATALMLTFTELLTTLIGESLTERLLAPAWARASAQEAAL
jgi:hypothetical protein